MAVQHTRLMPFHLYCSHLIWYTMQCDSAKLLNGFDVQFYEHANAVTEWGQGCKGRGNGEGADMKVAS